MADDIKSNRTKERIGINRVSTIIETEWECGWQEYAAHNDDAIDGVILMRRGTKAPRDTGGVVFVQVKCGANGYRQDQKQYPDHIGVSLGADYIQKHIPRWNATAGPCVLVFVDDKLNKKLPPAWWADLRAAETYSPTNGGMLLIPKSQRFEHHSKGDFHRLCGSQPEDRTYIQIELPRNEDVTIKLGTKESLRDDAWMFYKTWRGNGGPNLNPTLGPVLVNRMGWKHITRIGRRSERILQSWLLLGAAKKMVAMCEDVFILGHAQCNDLEDGRTLVTDYLGLRANVTFTHRHQSVVQVVLQRSRLIAPDNAEVERQKIWFYSVYELRRGRREQY